MNNMKAIFRQEEKAIFSLRALYENYGYKKYKMSKFEHYDLYLENKSFLTSEKIVTFTDPGGKLLALKPDITLSIIKNAPKEINGVYKAYYCENVYRADAGSDNIREIMQVGIELIGKVDLYSEAEVLLLAAKSLEEVSSESLIGVSHLGLVGCLLDEAGLDGSVREQVSKCIADKNVHTIKKLCNKGADKIAALAAMYGSFDEVLPQLRALCRSEKCLCAVKELEDIYKVLVAAGQDKRFVLDFSVSNDMSYYNGITFQGFIRGVPHHVLSGGRYDALVHKMGSTSNAVGFAVYPDFLERMSTAGRDYDVDLLIIYDDTCDPAEVFLAVEAAAKKYDRVSAVADSCKDVPTHKEIMYLGGQNEKKN